MVTPDVLGGRYRLDERLAAGGMGEVWRATDELLGRPVAVKLLKEQYTSDEEFRGRFRAEARYAASLQHGGIAQVYDYGEQGDLAYLVMELVPGETLSQILSRDGRLDPDTVLDIVGQAARALQAAHSAGIIHRDIKPANIMVTGDGTVKITDFGIARGGSSTVTQTGMVMGTAQYVSPEQATGKRISPASDLYSLGVVAYECLAGSPPFTADTPVALALKHVREDAPPLPADVPPAVRGLVSALMAKDPADRPSSAQEVADRAHVLRGSGRLADTAPVEESPAPVAEGDTAPSGGPGAGHRPGGRRLVLITACTAIVILAGVFVAGTLWKGSGHTKLMDRKGVQPASGNAPTRRPQRLEPSASEPTERPTSPGPFPTRTTPSPSPTPSSTMSSTPTTKPTKTTKPPTRPTESVPESPPAPPDPDPSDSAGGNPGTEGKV